MALVDLAKLDWHNPTCHQLDYVTLEDHLAICLNCGSSGLQPFPLPPLLSESSFRLLWLIPGEFDEVLRCNIHVENLQSSPNFAAISYTWADDNRDDQKLAEIFINDIPFLVTKNCHAALRRVRQRDVDMYVWIDAVCIDQNSNMERGHQVKLMPQIYHRAQKVLMYIGEHDDESRETLQNLKIYLHDPSYMKQHWKPLWEALETRKYFTRLWIIQEIALAKRAIVLCDNSSFLWSDITDWVPDAIKMGHDQQYSVLRFDRSLAITPAMELFVLDGGRPACAKDSRDKVYGLLGLLPGSRIGTVVADYTLSAQQLYTQVAIQLAKLHGWSAVLLRAGVEYQSLSSLPSWVPDWSSTTHGRQEHFTTSLSEVKCDHHPLVSENKVRLKVYRIPREDRWVLSDLQDGNIDTYMLFHRDDPIVNLLFQKEKEDHKHQRLKMRLEQRDTLECSSSVLCDATLNDMILMPIEQCVFEPGGDSKWSSFEHPRYSSMLYFLENEDYMGILRSGTQDVHLQERPAKAKLSEMVSQIYSWSYDICLCIFNIRSPEDNVRPVKDSVQLLGDAVRSLGDNVHWLRCILLFPERRRYYSEHDGDPRRHAASLWTNTLDKLSSLHAAVRSWRAETRSWGDGVSQSHIRWWGEHLFKPGLRGDDTCPWSNDTRFSRDDIDTLKHCYLEELSSLEYDTYESIAGNSGSRDDNRSSIDYWDRLSSLANNVRSWRDVICSWRDDICSYYFYQDRLRSRADPQDISWRDLAKHLKREPTEAWFCHAANLWAEKYPFKGTNESIDSKEHAPHFEAAVRADSKSLANIRAERQKDKEQEDVKEEKLASALFEMNDLLWRLLVQRFAVRSQLVEIA